MKRILVFTLVFLMICTAVLTACGESESGTSEAESKAESAISEAEKEESKAQSEAESKEDESTEASEESKEPPKTVTKLPTKYEEGSISLEAASYSEKPYFALIGRCSEGATVTAEAEGETVSSKSYKGWYSLRLKCSKKNVDVKISQSVDGAQVGETLEYTIKPVQPSSDMWPIVTGGDFQFFFQKMLPDFQGKNLPSQLQMNNLTSRIKTRLAKLHQNNPDAEIIYLIVPSSMTVYPELVPSQYTPADTTKLDKTMAALEAGGATVINLKEIFAEYKNDEKPLYYKLDSHWSDYGAFVAYTELFNHIAKKFPAAAPRGEDEFNWNPNYYKSGDMTYYLAMSQDKIKEYAYFRQFKDSVPSAVTQYDRYVSSDKLTYNNLMTLENVISTGNSKLPNCIVMRDSYSTQMYDILAERMNRTHYLGMWNYTWDNNMISRESPDYIIYILAEWNLDAVIKG